MYQPASTFIPQSYRSLRDISELLRKLTVIYVHEEDDVSFSFVPRKLSRLGDHRAVQNVRAIPSRIRRSLTFLENRRPELSKCPITIISRMLVVTSGGWEGGTKATMTFRENEAKRSTARRTPPPPPSLSLQGPLVFMPESFFYAHVEEQFDGSLWSGPEPFLGREGSCGRSGWPRKDLIRVRQRGFSRILTSGIRNELSKGLKLNTCKGES